MLVSDFDHTFFTLKFEENIKAINDFVARGNKFIIATNRNFTLLEEEIEFYDIQYEYLICKDGGIIFDKNKNEVFSYNINPELVKPIFNMLVKSRHIHEVLIDTGYSFEVDTNNGAKSIIAKIKNYDKVGYLLQEIFSKYPNVTGYLSESWINIIDSNVSKGNAINKICEIAGYNPNDIYTIGDGVNDISMALKYNGYAMENGVDELKKVSKGTVSSFKEFVDSL